MEQQLGLNDSENATALALTLNEQGGDKARLEQILASQFDSGSYELIEVSDLKGQPFIYRVGNKAINGAPEWFVTLFQLDVKSGVAPVQRGGQPLGTLTVRSDSGLAYRQLWSNTQKLAIIFLAAMILAGALGNYLLKRILSPLDNIVEQAGAIGDKRFVDIPEPRVPEYRKLAMAVNTLSQQTRKKLQQEGKQLEKLKLDARNDKVTGLINREPFLQAIEAAVNTEDKHARGSLSLVRVRGLAQLNQIYGRKAIDAMLKDMGNTLNRIGLKQGQWVASRLNGSDFAILAPRAEDPAKVAKEMQGALREILDSHSMPGDVRLPGAATAFIGGDSIGELLTRLDGALLAVDREGESSISVARKGDIDMKPIREQLDGWRSVFDKAFQEQLFSLSSYPVVGTKGELLHLESPVRLNWQGEDITAERILPWINRLEMSAELDQRVVDLALKQITRLGQPVCVNLSVASVVEAGFLSWISERLSSHAGAAEKLWLEVPEATVFRHMDKFIQLTTRVKDHGCKVGVEHAGHQLAELGRLHDAGIDYLKIDGSFVQGINDNPVNQTLFKTLSTVGHSINLLVIAESVHTDAEWNTLLELGADGLTGPGIGLE
jgi:EAL domain-containing protein (putative c-di-GMP-specific phosphodiesterase class I)